MLQEKKCCGATSYTECRLGTTIVLINASIGRVNNYNTLARTTSTPNLRQLHSMSAFRERNRLQAYLKELERGCGSCHAFITEKLTEE